MSDWRYITAADVREGELIESRDFPNRMRVLPSGLHQIEVHAVGAPFRVKLPFDLVDLPLPVTEPNEWHNELTGEFGAHGQPLDRVVLDSVRKRWFEHVGGETHMVIEMVE